MFIIQVTYTAPIVEIDRYLQAHREFLDYYYKQGLLLASGPMVPREGGIIIAVGNDRKKIETLFKEDPYYLAGIAEYRFTEFTPVKHCDALKTLILDTEGKLC